MCFGGRKRRFCPSFGFKLCQAPAILTRALAPGSAGAKPHHPSPLPRLRETPNPTSHARQGLDGIPPSREGAGSKRSRPAGSSEPSRGGFGRESRKDGAPTVTGADDSRPGTSTVWFLLRIQVQAFPPFQLTPSPQTPAGFGHFTGRKRTEKRQELDFWAVLAPNRRRNPRWVHLHLRHPRWLLDNPSSSVTFTLRRRRGRGLSGKGEEKDVNSR